MMAKVQIIDVVVSELEAAGLEYQIDRRGRHPKVRFFVQGQRFTYVVPLTESDHRSLLNCRAGVRRLIRKALQESDLPSAQE